MWGHELFACVTLSGHLPNPRRTILRDTCTGSRADALDPQTSLRANHPEVWGRDMCGLGSVLSQ